MDAANRKAADTLIFMGELLEIKGEDPYKIRAFYRAAEEVGRLPRSVAGMSDEELREIRGVGKAIAQKIQDIVSTGTFPELEEVKATIPPTLLELLEVPGVGPKTVNRLWKKLGVLTLDDLERAARGHRIRAVSGFGEKKEADILQAIQLHRSRSRRMTLPEAGQVVAKVTAVLQPGTFAVAGSYRRGKSTIGDIDIVSTEHPQTLRQRLLSVSEELIDEGERRTSIRVLGQRVDIRFAEPRQCGSMLLYLTGSKNFNIRLREIAIGKGWRINEYGIEEREAGGLREFDTEHTMFAALGMDYIHPHLREDRGEIALARAHALPRVLEDADIRGDLHVHTQMSDGHLTLEEVAHLGAGAGYEYILVSDHSASLGIAKGLDAVALERQRKEIDAVNDRSRCTLLHGIEVDIAADGSLTLPNHALATLDLVIASVHGGLKQDPDVMTRRVITAIENEHVDIIGHPTGRLLGERPPAAMDMERVIDAAAENGTALEVNASPHRLDLDDDQIKNARDRGVKLSLGTDAHDAAELQFMRFGVITARRGWCRREDVLNTMSLGDLRTWSS
jgi:DNA polymerase (family 10)